MNSCVFCATSNWSDRIIYSSPSGIWYIFLVEEGGGCPGYSGIRTYKTLSFNAEV